MSQLDTATARATLNLAVGRLLRIMWKPETMPEDTDFAAEFHRCRATALDCADVLGINYSDDRPNYASDHNRGAAGD